LRAHGEFLLPGSGAREHQVGDIHASDQQDESHGAEQISRAGAHVATSCSRTVTTFAPSLCFGELLLDLFRDAGTFLSRRARWCRRASIAQ